MTTPVVTRATLITEKYTILTNELKTFFDAELFPSLDSIDIADLVFFITVSFLNVNTEDQFTDKIIDLITSNGFKITDKQMVRVVPLIQEFVLWIRAL